MDGWVVTEDGGTAVWPLLIDAVTVWLWGRRWEVAEKVGCSVHFGSGFTGNAHGNEDRVGIKLELRLRASLEHNLSPPRSWKNLSVLRESLSLLVSWSAFQVKSYPERGWLPARGFRFLVGGLPGRDPPTSPSRGLSLCVSGSNWEPCSPLPFCLPGLAL